MTDAERTLRTMAKDYAARYADDAQEAINRFRSAAKRTSEWETYVDSLVNAALADMIYDARHERTRQIKKDAGAYGGPPRVAQISEDVSTALDEVYQFCIAGRTIGDLRGSELADIEAHERRLSDGHLVNATIIASLRTRVTGDQRVADRVTARQLRRIIREARAQYEEGGEDAA